jgi:hypothetical protein
MVSVNIFNLGMVNFTLNILTILILTIIISFMYILSIINWSIIG